MKRLLIAIAVVVVILLVAAQLVLPGVAERRAREDLSRVGVVTEVEVESFPAVKLLAGQVDTLTARVRQGRTSTQEIGDLIAKAEGVDRLHIAVAPVELSGLELERGSLAKDGARLEGEASMDEAGIRAALPGGSELRSVSSEGGEVLVDGSFSLLGFEYSGPVKVAPRDGAITASPEGLSLASLAQLTLFEHPRVRVERLGAREVGDGLRVSAGGRLTGP